MNQDGDGHIFGSKDMYGAVKMKHFKCKLLDAEGLESVNEKLLNVARGVLCSLENETVSRSKASISSQDFSKNCSQRYFKKNGG